MKTRYKCIEVSFELNRKELKILNKIALTDSLLKLKIVRSVNIRNNKILVVIDIEPFEIKTRVNLVRTKIRSILKERS